MSEDNNIDDAMSEKILHDLDVILRSNNDIQEFAIITTQNNDRNKSPVIFTNNCVALESWCVKSLFKHTQSFLLKSRGALARNRLPPDEMRNLNVYLNGALLIMPEVTTFWNMKRELLESSVNSEAFEFRFSRLVLTVKPKSLEVFVYRRWLIKRHLQHLPNSHGNDDFETIWLRLFNEELLTVTLAAGLSHNNYHAWTHRSWLVDLGLPSRSVTAILCSELQASVVWISSHVSEHASYQYRQVLLKKLRGISSERSVMEFLNTSGEFIDVESELYEGVIVKLAQRNLTQVLEHNLHFALASKTVYFCLLLVELVYVLEKLNSIFTGHETIWYHRRFCLYSLIEVIYAGYGVVSEDFVAIASDGCNKSNIIQVYKDCEGKVDSTTLGKSNTYGLMRAKSNYFYELVVQLEKDFIKKCAKTDLSDVESDLLIRHKLWLKNVLNFDVTG